MCKTYKISSEIQQNYYTYLRERYIMWFNIPKRLNYKIIIIINSNNCIIYFFTLFFLIYEVQPNDWEIKFEINSRNLEIISIKIFWGIFFYPLTFDIIILIISHLYK